MTNVDNTPEQEVNDAPEETVIDSQDTDETTDDSAEETVGSYQEEETQENKVPDSIPYNRFQEVNKEKKQLEEQLKELKKEKEADSSVSDTEKDPDVKALAKELAELREETTLSKQERQRAKVEAALDSGLNKALENNPEFKDIANAAVIKQMALNPANKDKTFTALLEEAYGNAIGGKRTTETTTARGGAANTKVDMDRASRDAEYRREVLADPDLRNQYNAQRTVRL